VLKIDWEVREENLRKLDLASCYQCGRCSSACPIHRFRPEFDPRRFVFLLEVGSSLPDDVLWICSYCDRCVECPQGVSPREILVTLRNDLFPERAPPEVEAMISHLMRTGWIAPVRGPNRIRERMGLPPLKEVSFGGDTG